MTNEEQDQLLARFDERFDALKEGNFQINKKIDRVEILLLGKNGANGLASIVKLHQTYWKIALGVLTLFGSILVAVTSDFLKKLIK